MTETEAREHLICEFCKAEFDALAKYLEHKKTLHADAVAAQERVLDEQVAESFPASDVPAATTPTAGVVARTDEE